ncbi:MAG: PilZ domain-containing protein [Acidobacteriia bacterium]|nr:PilZ domain-containing protein [Terriglobia bacterium]
MPILHFRSVERRRTARVTLPIRLVVSGHTETSEKFSVKTRSLSVSGHGGLLSLDATVVVGQTFQLINENNQREAECKVVSIRRGRDGKTNVAFEFVDPQTNFWNMFFPAVEVKPLRRAGPSRISVCD